MNALRPVFTDAHLWALFLAAADRLEGLDGEGFADELSIMEDGIAALDDGKDLAEGDRVIYIQGLLDLQNTYKSLRAYFIDHDEFGWADEQEDLFPYRDVDFIAIAAMR